MGSQTFSYTGAVQTFTVPTGVTSILGECWGGAGGNGGGQGYTSIGGLGGYATGSIPVTPGETLWLYVGGVGATVTTNGQNPASSTQAPGGWNGGGTGTLYGMAGGGGGTDIRRGGQALSNRVLIGAGGGGAGNPDTSTAGHGGAGGGLTGQSANSASTQYAGRTGGLGGTQTAGGAAGGGAAGTLGVGANTTQNLAGGGGGGYYGGSTGANSTAGGGGSSFIGSLANGSTTQGVRSGSGQIKLTWAPSPPTVVVPATVTSGSTILVTWTKNDTDPQTGFQLQYMKPGDATWTTVTGTTATSYNLDSTGTDGAWQVQVATANSSGYGSFSAPQSVNVTSPPGQPTGLAASPTTVNVGDPVTLSWTDSLTGGDPQQQYQLRWRKID